MSHGGLSGARCDPTFAEVRTKRVPQGNNVHRTTAIVFLRNVGKLQVAVPALRRVYWKPP